MNNQLYKDLSKLTIYDDDEINQMIIDYQAGNESQLNKIIESNLKLITFYAKKFDKYIRTSEVLELEDLIAEGVFGIRQAAVKFNPTLNIKFSYYASHWIKNQITNFIINNRNTIRIPIEKIKSNNRISKEIETLFQQSENEISRYDVEKLDKFSQSEIDCYFNELELIDIDYQTDLFEVEIEDFDAGNQLKAMINKVLKHLTPKQRMVIKMMYGIDQAEKSTKEICNELNITKQNLYQFKIGAFNKIKKIIESKI